MRLLIATILVLLFVTTVAATVVSEPLRINTIRVPDYVHAGDYFQVYVNYEAEDGRELKNLKVRALVMDTGYYRSDGRFDIDNRRSSRFDLVTSADAEGWALIRVVISNDKIKRIKHRWVKVV